MTPALIGLLGLTLTANADTPTDTLPAELVEAFDAAEAAWAAGDLQAAERGYRTVNEEAPGFDRAWRRRCGVVLAQDRAWEAVELCDRALTITPSVENRTGMALALIRPDPGDPPGHRSELDRAKALIDQVILDDPSYLTGWQALCSYGMEASDDDALQRCVEHLEARLPGEVGTLYFRTVLDVQLGEWEHAFNTLRAARSRGLSDALFEPLAVRLKTELGPEGQPSAGRIRTVANLQPRTEWTWADVLPLGIAGALVLVVFLVAFFGGDEEEPQP